MLGRATSALVVLILLGATPAQARDWFVAPGGTGDGSSGAPFGGVQQGLDAAAAGDVVVVAAGTYTGAIQTARAGTEVAPITVRATGDVLVTSPGGRVLTIAHPYHVFDGLTLDGQYGDDDAVRIETAADFTVLRECEIRRATKDCVDMGSPANVTIESSLIHHCLNAAGGRTDAHGIVAGAVRDLTVRNTEIHTFSGDAIQLDPDRLAPGWDRVLIEGCRLWLAPLPQAENGFPAGAVPGENAIDTKVMPGRPAHIKITDTIAYGYRGGLITNMAAFNLKEEVIANVNGITVSDSEIALRLRAPADVAVLNAVIFDVDAGIRYEDGLALTHVHSSTFGRDVTEPFVEASSPTTVMHGINLLFLADALPPELTNAGGCTVADATAFVAAASDNYHLTATSPVIDQGVDLVNATDRDGVARPQGSMQDVGAYEYCADCTLPTPDADPGGGDDVGDDDGGGKAGGCCSTTNRAIDAWPALIVVGLLVRRRRRRR